MENGKNHLRASLFTIQFTCFTGTKGQILTPEALRGRQEALGHQASSVVSGEGGAQNHVAQVQKYTYWYKHWCKSANTDTCVAHNSSQVSVFVLKKKIWYKSTNTENLRGVAEHRRAC